MKTTSLVLGNSYVLWTSNVYVPAGSGHARAGRGSDREHGLRRRCRVGRQELVIRGQARGRGRVERPVIGRSADEQGLRPQVFRPRRLDRQAVLAAARRHGHRVRVDIDRGCVRVARRDRIEAVLDRVDGAPADEAKRPGGAAIEVVFEARRDFREEDVDADPGRDRPRVARRR